MKFVNSVEAFTTAINIIIMKKKVQVHRVPTGDITGIVLHSTGLDRVVHTKESELNAVLNIGGTSQHLYFTSDEKIEEGDWMLNLSGIKHNEQIISKCSKNAAINWKDNMLINNGTKSIRDCIRKIVATTDKTLSKIKVTRCSNINCEGGIINGFKPRVCKKCNPDYKSLPQIPQSFIKQYVEAGGKIDEVEIEYEERQVFESAEDYDYGFGLKIEVDSNNCVIVHPIEERLYTRREMIRKIMQFDMSMGRDITTEEFDNWIKENL